MFQTLYRAVFWTGYLAVLITTFLPVAGELNRIKLGPDALKIRLDHLLHFSAYFLICMYYLAGRWKGVSLFNRQSLFKFFFLVLLLAVVTEVVQLWVPARSFNVFDLVSNVAGVVVGTGVVVMAQGTSLRRASAGRAERRTQSKK